jgi:hypothetical protein
MPHANVRSLAPDAKDEAPDAVALRGFHFVAGSEWNDALHHQSLRDLVTNHVE